MAQALELQIGSEFLEVEIPAGTTAGEVITVLVRNQFLPGDQAYVLEWGGRRLDTGQRMDELDLETSPVARVLTSSGRIPQLLPPLEPESQLDVEEPSVEPPAMVTEDPAYEAAFQTLRRLRTINQGLVDFRIKDADRRIFEVHLKYRTVALYKTPRGDLPTVMIGNKVEIHVPPDYPDHRPELIWISPIFHPNVVTGEPVRLPRATASARLSLEEALAHLVEMVQYKNDKYNLDAAVNQQAAEWARDNGHLFPIGLKTLVTESSTGELEDEVEVESEVSSPEETAPTDEPPASEEETVSSAPDDSETPDLPVQTRDVDVPPKARLRLRATDSELEVRLPLTTTPAKLTGTIMAQLSLPTTDDAGQPVDYAWTLASTGQRLAEDQSLEEQGINDGDLLVLTRQENS